MNHWIRRHKYIILQSIKQIQEKNKIHTYAKLGRGSKGFYIKCYEFKCYSKLGVSFNVIKYKYIIKYHHGYTLNYGKEKNGCESYHKYCNLY